VTVCFLLLNCLLCVMISSNKSASHDRVLLISWNIKYCIPSYVREDLKIQMRIFFRKYWWNLLNSLRGSAGTTCLLSTAVCTLNGSSPCCYNQCRHIDRSLGLYTYLRENLMAYLHLNILLLLCGQEIRNVLHWTYYLALICILSGLPIIQRINLLWKD
jgi:hypothetical protein